MSQNKELEKIISYFKDISKIPRSSGDEKAISDYLVAFAKERGLEYVQDEHYNVIIKKPAFPGEEHRPGIIFQGHTDMVYVKTEDSKHCYEDGIEVLDDGQLLHTKDTTLGADNGIAVCYALALLDSTDIKHPPLEFIFTVDEEAGMIGAETIDTSILEGKALINLDSEDEGKFCVGCAGGITNEFLLPIKKETLSGEFVPVELLITGLQGGHSGVEIQMERGNAIKLLGRLLYQMREENFYIKSVDGPGKANVISQKLKMVCYTESANVSSLVNTMRECEQMFQEELQFSDNVEFQIVVGETVNSCEVYTRETAGRLRDVLMLFPYGVFHWSMGVKGLVETSSNPGILKEKDGKVAITSLIRSSVQSQKEAVCNRLEVLADAYGAESICGNPYPGWSYKKESKLRDLAIQKYEALFGKKAIIEAIHAGLECGFWEAKIPGVDIISMGPDMWDIHTPKERISKQSIANIWELVKAIVEAYS